jgi:hypothetical protein
MFRRLLTGKGSGRPSSEFDARSLRKGQLVEMEHTRDPRVALRIAKDHLWEFPDYYERLEKMERDAEKYWAGESSDG